MAASIHDIPTLPSPIRPAGLPHDLLESELDEPEPPTLRRVPFDDDDERFFRDGEADAGANENDEESDDDWARAARARRPLMKPVGVVVVVAALLCFAALGRELPAAAATGLPACVDAPVK